MARARVRCSATAKDKVKAKAAAYATDPVQKAMDRDIAKAKATVTARAKARVADKDKVKAAAKGEAMDRAKGGDAAASSRESILFSRIILLNDKAENSLPCAESRTMEGSQPCLTNRKMNPTVEDLELSDAILVSHAKEGNSDAFGKLFNRHYPKVYRFAINMGASADDAQDIVQTAFIRTHKSLANIRDGQALLSYLYQAAMNGVRDTRRRASRKPWTSLTELLKPRAEKQFAQAAVSFDETQSGLRDALAINIKALPDDFREVFVLHHLQDLDLNQIAEIQGVPVGTVKSRLGRARERMRAAMKPWLDGDEAK